MKKDTPIPRFPSLSRVPLFYLETAVSEEETGAAE